MRVYYKLIIIAGILLMGLPLMGQCSWKDDACADGDERTCQVVSNNFTVPYCVSSEVDYAHVCNFSSLTNSLSLELSKAGEKSSNIKTMISQYCSSLLGDQNHGRIYYAQPSILTDSRDWHKTFDSQQSLFVHLLCSYTVNQTGSIDLSGVFTGNVVKILKLQQMSDGKDQCLKDDLTLNDCDMSIYATEIFSAMMSEIFKIKYAQISHVDSIKFFDNNKKKRALTFLSGYFDITSEEDIKYFPDTVDVIDSNQNHYKTVLKSLKILDNEVLAKRAEESKCPMTGNMVGVDFVACALHGSQGNGLSLNTAFETLIYNEIMSYRIFVSYYLNWTQAKISKSDESVNNKEILQSKAMDLQSYSELQIEAVKQTLHDFEEMNMTYPLHIGLLLYQEKAREFRNKYLPPVVQIFYSLSEKLQNVQIPR